MTVYELDKLSTPGPWVPCRPEKCGDSLVSCIDGRHVAYVYGIPNPVDTNDRLLCHCRNNFIRALEVLVSAHARLYGVEYREWELKTSDDSEETFEVSPELKEMALEIRKLQTI